MTSSSIQLRHAVPVLLTAALALTVSARGNAEWGERGEWGQRGRGGEPTPPSTPQAAAPIDLIGYWVSVVTEDWRYRMVTPPKGDYASVPLNAEGRKVADVWDPAKDEASGNQCKSYGAANIMRVPGRVHITWQDDNNLKIDTDAGTQSRLLHFGDAQPPAGDAGWQGYSVAQWEIAGPPQRGGGGGGGGGRGVITIAGVVQGAPADAPGGRGRGGPQSRGGSLKVITTHLKAGYLRKNGVPYSENAVVTEYFDRHTEPNGDQWFTVTTIVEDPKYLDQPFVTSTHFKKEPDAGKWHPTACSTS
ncbi:MAG: hypothetical protein AUH72_14390 [Acidobacteria bacterium 13_1_40CM_4_65_8]|nr:MAG: hypothetical protein AUH72_14390 [Acidobacteria bacterium 13_1_40CM_4_65_8]